jgi:hypothetical protein
MLQRLHPPAQFLSQQ